MTKKKHESCATAKMTARWKTIP